MPLLVYGVVRREHPSPTGDGAVVTGVDLVGSGSLAAAVTEVAEGVELSEQDATRHLDVLVRLLRDGPVLPLAFGTVSPDENAVRAEVLDPVAADLTRRLDAVDGLVEARLDLFFDEAVALRTVLEANPDLQGLAAGARSEAARLGDRIALGEAVSAHLTQWRQMRVEALLPTLASSCEAVAELESSEPLQQRWAFLVSADRLPDLDDAVAGIRGELGEGAAVEYVGPLPVYNFMEQVTAAPAGSGSAWGW